jgi:vanillate O-demethylase ferredoxin subunit
MDRTEFPASDRAVIEQIVADPRFRGLAAPPRWAWQQLTILAASYGVVLLGAVGYLGGILPYPLVLVASALAIYAVFTPLHDATHNAASGDPFVNDRIGDVGATLLFPGFTTRVYRRLHLAHHRYTGEHDRDPDDMMVTARFPWSVLLLAFYDLWWFSFVLRRREGRSRAELVELGASIAVSVAWHAAWLLSPFAWQFVLLWLLPQRLAVLILAYTFGRIQHPEGVEQRKDPLHATRMLCGGRVMRWFTLGQSEHLMHHLFPSIPWYRYHEAWEASRPLLADRDLVWQWPVPPFALPRPRGAEEQAVIPVRVVEAETVGRDVRSFVLESAGGARLPAFEAGAHVDLHLGAGLVRQYSLCGDPAERDRYRIAVKYEAEGRGGSRRAHELLEPGAVVEIGAPRNLFPLDAGASRVVLVAGGIGITPLLAMAHALHRLHRDFTLHVCARSRQALAFDGALARMPWSDRVVRHLDDTPETMLGASDLPRWRPGDRLYLCGPSGFMQWVLSLAAERGWPDEALHTETFVTAQRGAPDGRPFEVELARSRRTLQVPTDSSLLDVLQGEGLPVSGSCTQGMCGACRVPVLDGAIDHRDAFLSADERARGDCMTTCVSRAGGERLVLDL